MPKSTYKIYTLLTVVFISAVFIYAAGTLTAQDKALRFDAEVLEQVKTVIKGTENPFRQARTVFTPSKQLKPAHEVWQQWEKLKAAEKPKPVNADTPAAELKMLAETGNQNALQILREQLLQKTVDENTSPTMLEAFAKIGHAGAKSILQKKEDDERQRQNAEIKRKAEEDAKRKKEEERVKEEVAAKQAEQDKRKREQEEKDRIAKEEERKEKEKRLEELKAQAAEGNKVADVFPGGKECYILKKDGTLWGMGENSSGQLGVTGRQDVPILIAASVKDVFRATDAKCYFHKKDGTLWETGGKTPVKVEYAPDEFGFALYKGNLVKGDGGNTEPKEIVKNVKQYAAVSNDTLCYIDSSEKLFTGKLRADGYLVSEPVGQAKVYEILVNRYCLFVLTKENLLWKTNSERPNSYPYKIADRVKSGTLRQSYGKNGIWNYYFIREDDTLWYGYTDSFDKIAANVVAVSDVVEHYCYFITKNKTAFKQTYGKPIVLTGDVADVKAGLEYVYLIKEDGTLWKCKIEAYSDNINLERIEVPETPLDALSGE